MPEEHPVASQAPKRRRRWLRWLAALVVVIVAGLVGLELFGRFYLGLGDPPLYVASATMEYANKPDSTFHRFGHLVHYNHYSMRADDFPPAKSSPHEFRLLVMGDSVIDGGSLTDQSQLATQRLIPMLHKALGRPVVVGNVSAGSWGPGNLLAWTEKFGALDADWVVIELSSHDAQDARDFKPVVGVLSSYPDHKPMFALEEAITRYLPRYVPDLEWGDDDEDHTPKIDQPLHPKRVKKCMAALRQLVTMVRGQGAEVVIAQHADRAEATNRTYKPGHDVILHQARKLNVPTIQLRPIFADAIDAGHMPYRDKIHPNPYGQKLMAREIYDFLIKRIQTSAGDAETGATAHTSPDSKSSRGETRKPPLP